MLNYFIFHAISLLIFWAFYQIFLKKDTFFERNRYYLLLTVSLACLAPLLEMPVSEVVNFEEMPAKVREAYIIGMRENEGLGQKEEITNIDSLPHKLSSPLQVFSLTKLFSSKSINWQEILVWIYGAGVLISVILFLVRIGKLLLLISQFQRLAGTSSTDNVNSSKTKVSPVGKDLEGALKNIKVIPNENASTFSFFNYLFWDNSLNMSEKEEQQILLHELAHIKGKHSYDLIFIELHKIIFWFNPIIYLYQKELINQHEFIADSKALNLSNTDSYISLMVSSLFKSLQLNLTHSFHNPQIKQRIKMLNTQKTSGLKGNAKSMLAGLIIGCVVVGFACTKGLEKMAQESSFKKAEKALMSDYLAESEEFEKKYPNMEMKYSFREESKYNDYYKISFVDRIVADIDIKGISNDKERERLKYILLELNKYWARQEAIRREEHTAERKKWDSMFGTDAEPINGWESIEKQMPCFQEVNTEEVLGYNKWGTPIKRVYWSVRGVVNEKGEVESVKLVEGTGNKECDENFLKLIKSMKWKPSIKDGKAKQSHFSAAMPFVKDKSFYKN